MSEQLDLASEAPPVINNQQDQPQQEEKQQQVALRQPQQPQHQQQPQPVMYQPQMQNILALCWWRQQLWNMIMASEQQKLAREEERERIQREEEKAEEQQRLFEERLDAQRREFEQRYDQQQREVQQQLAEQDRQHKQDIERQVQIGKDQLAQQKDHHAQMLKVQKESSFKQQIQQLESRKQEIISEQLNPIKSQLSTLEKKIATEERDISGMELERNDKSKKIIVCVGKTGHGKSTVVNRLAGDTSQLANNGPCRTSNSAQSCTQSLQKQYDSSGTLCIIDCPGWADTGGADSRHSNDLCSFLKGCGGINAIVLVRSATDYRFDADFKLKLQHLAHIFGDLFWNNLVIILTHVDKGLNEQQFEQNNKAHEMRQEVIRFSGKNIQYPVIPIGLDNYQDKIRMIIDSIPQIRFICNEIKSPIDDLKAERDEIIITNGEIEAKINQIDDKINLLNAQILSL